MQKTRGRAAEQLSEKKPELFRYPPLDEMFGGKRPPGRLHNRSQVKTFYATPEIMEEYGHVVVTFVSAIAKYFEEHAMSTIRADFKLHPFNHRHRAPANRLHLREISNRPRMHL
jgi:hypothetical protein